LFGGNKKGFGKGENEAPGVEKGDGIMNVKKTPAPGVWGLEKKGQKERQGGKRKKKGF